MKLVILDRDGVINEDSDDYIKSPSEWIPIPNSIEAITLLTNNGFSVAIATNQSGLSRQLFDLNTLEQINKKMINLIKSLGGDILGVWYCPHLPSDNCDCRKPKTKMLKDILNLTGFVEEIYMVGDSLKDLQAIDSIGGIPVLVLTGKGKKTLMLHKNKIPMKTLFFNNLWGFASYCCSIK